MNAKRLQKKVAENWTNNGCYSAIYADKTIEAVPFPENAKDEGLVGVYRTAPVKQLKEDFAEVGLVLE